MLQLIEKFNFAILILFTVMYLYQIGYIFVVLFHDAKGETKAPKAKKKHKFAVLVAARNEEDVIGQLLASISEQTYPSELVQTFVIADNCTDNTAEVARQAGAIVLERENKELVGKGYALDYAFHIILDEYKDENYEGFFVFDADNLLDENYISEMNKTFDQGYRVLTSYRNSKNFDSNWITAGYSLWFMREAKFLNNARMILNTSCAISGTGFLIHSDIIKRDGGWKCHLLTEDIEFSVANVVKGETFGYCNTAVLYDEQPDTFKASWTQRMRWAKGFYQVLGKHGKSLFKSMFKGSKRAVSSYDMMMTITPAMLLSISCIFINLGFFLYGWLGIQSTGMMWATVRGIGASLGNFYLILFIIGLLTTITEWGQIHAKASRKIWSAVTFPFFMLTYIPIAIVALFKKVEWKPIKHSVAKSIAEIKKERKVFQAKDTGILIDEDEEEELVQSF